MYIYVHIYISVYKRTLHKWNMNSFVTNSHAAYTHACIFIYMHTFTHPYKYAHTHENTNSVDHEPTHHELTHYKLTHAPLVTLHRNRLSRIMCQTPRDKERTLSLSLSFSLSLSLTHTHALSLSQEFCDVCKGEYILWGTFRKRCHELSCHELTCARTCGRCMGILRRMRGPEYLVRRTTCVL